jgi:hypothetical protein
VSFSEGGTDIREVQAYLNPEAEQYLDWFHMTMRIPVLAPHAKELDTGPERRESVWKILERERPTIPGRERLWRQKQTPLDTLVTIELNFGKLRPT